MLEHPTSEIGLPVLAAICRRSVFPASYSPVEFLQTVRAGVVSRTQFLHFLLTPATIFLLKVKPCDQAGQSGFSPLSGAMGGSQRDGSARDKRRIIEHSVESRLTKNAKDWIRVNREFDSNEMDENSELKHASPKISTLRGIKIDSNEENENTTASLCDKCEWDSTETDKRI
jgi:hypothetical protein